MKTRRLNPLFAALLLCSPLHAVNVTWNGSVDGNWATTANWTGGLPAGNSVFLFATGAPNLNTSLTAPVSVASLNFNNSEASATVTATFTTATLTLTGGVNVTAGNHYLQGPGGSGQVDVVLPSATTWAISSGCTLTNTARIVRSGSGTITKTLSGTLIMGKDLSGSSSSKASWLANGGILRFTVNGAFGSPTNNCTNSGGTIELVNANCPVATLTLNGTGFNNLGALHLVSGNQNTSTSALVLGSNATINVDSGATLTTSSAVSGGSFALSKSGSGSLVMTGASTFTGNTNVNAGTLSLTGSGSLSSAAISIGTSGIFDVSAISFTLGGTQSITGTGTVNGNVTDSSGSGIRPAGTGPVGTLTFNNDLNLAGGDTVKFDFTDATNDLINVGGNLNPGGVTEINLTTAPPSGYVSGASYVLFHVLGTLGGSTANFNLTGVPAGARQSFNLAYSGNDVVLQVTGTPASLVWAGGLNGNIWDTNTTANWTNGIGTDQFFTADAVSFTDAGLANANVNLPAAVLPSSVTVANTTGNYVLSGAGSISGGTGLTKNGTGTFTLGTVNAYTGATVINDGTLVLGATNAIPGGTGKGNTTLTGGTLDLNQNSVTLNNLSGAGTVDTVTGGTPTLTVNCTATTTFSGTLQNTSGALSLTKSGAGALTLSGSNTLGGACTINAGTLTLTNSNNFNGGTTLSAGRLNINSASALGSGALTLSGGSFDNGSGSSQTLSPIPQNWNGSFTFVGSSSLNLGSGAVTLNATPTLTVSANTLTVDGDISGSFGLIKAGSGYLELAGNNTFDGGFNLNAGVLTLNSSGALGSTGTISFGGGILQFSANNTTDYSSRFSTAFSQPYYLDVPTSLTVTLAGNLSSSGGTLTKTGLGLLVVSGANNTYTGTTTIGGSLVGNRVGTLRVTATQALGTGTVIIGPSGGSGDNNVTACLELSGGITLNNNISLPTRSSSNPTVGIENISGNNTLTGTLTVGSGANVGLIQSDADLLTLGAITGQSGNKTTYLQGAGNGLVSGDITNGAGTSIAIRKEGTGTWTLAGNNTYTGSTTVIAGTLVISQNNSLDDAATVNLANSSSLSLTYSGTDQVGTLIINGVTQPNGTYTFGTGKLRVGPPTASPFEDWAILKGLDGTPGKENGPADDPDKDGVSNLAEFAFKGNPLSGSDNGIVRHFTADSSDVGTSEELILTIAVRSGTPAFTGTPSPTAAQDGITYTVQGSINLAAFATGVTAVDPITTGLPDLTGSGYEYRSFSLDGSNGLTGNGFLRAMVTSP